MEELNKTNEEQPELEPSSNKKMYIIIGVLAALLIGAGIYFYVASKSKSETTIPITKNDSIAKKDSLKGIDSTAIGEEGDSPYSENVVIANGVNLGDHTLNFGDKVYIDDSKSNESTACFYLENPMTNKSAKSYQGDATLFIAQYRFEDYRKSFALPPFSGLPSGVKKILLEDTYNDGDQFAVTQNADRAKSSVCFGDFDGDGHLDVAALQDNNSKQICRLLVICSNSVTKLPYTAYTEKFSDKMRINSFKKGSLVYMNSSDFVNSPIDGVMINGEDAKIALIYDKNLQKFKSYFQQQTDASASEEGQ